MLRLVSGPSLAELEAWLVAVSTEPAGVSAGIRRASQLHAAFVDDIADLGQVVTPGPKLSALERLAIYNDGYFARLVECLVDDYPALQHALGPVEFERVARVYIDAHPSRSRSLNAYGARVEAYLRTRSDAWAPFAADLARLEWALVEAVHAEAPPGLEPSALARLRPGDWPRARLVASPALRVLDFRHPVDAFYRSFREEAQPEMPAPARTALAVHRSGFAVTRVPLDPAMRCLLGDLARGTLLGEAVSHLEQVLTRSELEVAQRDLPVWFQSWVAAGFFVGLEVD